MMLRAGVQTWLWRFGWAWPIATFVAASAAAMYFGVVRPQTARIASSQAALQELQQAQATAATPSSNATDVRAVIAASASADQIVAQMAKLAQAEGIVLSQSEYQQQAMADAPPVQVQVTQPVHATYPQVRRYVEAVLRSVPNAALEQLTARRDNVSQVSLDARLRWSVWVPPAATRGGVMAAPDHEPARDLFAARSWAPPPPPSAPAAPQAPAAPPLPFAYLGKKLEGDGWDVFLARDEQTFIVKEGAVIDGAWRVDKVQPPMLVVTYLPLGQPQTLAIGDPP